MNLDFQMSLLWLKIQGVSLPDTEISAIFKNKSASKYGTSGEKGTGLGLMLCMEFLEKEGCLVLKYLLHHEFEVKRLICFSRKTCKL